MDPSLAHELTTHAEALRALARQLVGERDADDLVQDTALAALRARPDARGGLWGWLARVLRNRARNERRDTARRAHREEGRAAPEPGPSAARVAEAHESVQRLTGALLALPEPYHGVLLMRFFEGLTPTAIAAATGEPLATVKSRLQRGLALLRERLDVGERRDAPPWRQGLCAAFGLDQAARAGAAAAVMVGVTGAMLMGTAAKVGVVTAAAAAAVFAFVWPGAAGVPGRSGTHEAADVPPVVASASAADLPAVHAPVQEPDAPRVAVTPVAAGERGPEATVRGRCVDERGTPVAGVRVQLTNNARSDEAMAAWTKDHEPPPDTVLDATTGADGIFTFAFWPPPPMQYFVTFGAEGRAHVAGCTGDLVPGAVREIGDLVMPRGVLFRGRVSDRAGAPAAARRIEFRSVSEPQGEIAPLMQARTASRTDGTFATVHGVPAGVYRIVVTDAEPQPCEVTVDGSVGVVEVDVVVAAQPVAEPPLRGIVVDEAGAPVPGAEVGVASYHARAGHSPDQAVRTDAAGAFTLQPAPRSPPTVTLAARAPGFESFEAQAPMRWGEDGVRIVLRRAGGIALQVVRAEDRSPVEHFQARLTPGPGSSFSFGIESMRVRASGHHDGGRALLDGVARGPWWIVVEPKGDELALAAFVPVTVGDGGPVPVTVALQRTVARTVHVRNSAGVPVAGTVVELGWMGERQATSDTHAHPLDDHLWAQSRAALRIAAAATDAAGSCVMRGPAATSLVVFVRGPGHVPFVAQPARLDEPGPLELTVDAGTTVRGTASPLAVLADLRGLANLPSTGDVEPTLRRMLPGVRLWRRDGPPNYFPRTSQPIAADGSFRIDGVPAGRWEVQIAWSEPTDAGSRSFLGKQAAVATIDANGTPIELQLDLSPFRTGELDATVMRGDAPAAGARVFVRLDGDEDNQSARSVNADAAGRCRLRLRTGRWELHVHDEHTALPAPERAVVVAGETVRQTFHVASATLKLKVVNADGTPAPGVRVDLEMPHASPPSSAWLPRTDAAGCTTIVVPPGRCLLTVLPEAWQDPAAQERLLEQQRSGVPFPPLRIELAHVDTVPGAVVERELRLPASYRR